LLLAREEALLAAKQKGTALWRIVSDHLHAQGWLVTNRQCSLRYSTCLKPASQGLSMKVDWTPKLVRAIVACVCRIIILTIMIFVCLFW